MNDFPSQVNSIQAPGNAGDFASANPRGTVLAGEGGLISGLGVVAGVQVQGAVVGRFGWSTYQSIDNDNAPGTVNTFGAGVPQGLVARRQIGLITQYLGTAVVYLQTGFQIALYNEVDMWVVNNGPGPALVNQKAFANFADGSASFAAAGSVPAGGSGSASSIAAGAFSATGTIVGDVFTATGAVTGANGIQAGGTLSGTGVAAGTKVVGQITPLLAGETLGGVGRYNVSIPEQNAASTTITGAYGILTVGGTVVAGFGTGQTVTGGTIAVPTTIFQQLTGTAGAAGTYVVDVATVVASAALSSQSSVETKWFARSSGAVGEIIKISNII